MKSKKESPRKKIKPLLLFLPLAAVVILATQRVVGAVPLPPFRFSPYFNSQGPKAVPPDPAKVNQIASSKQASTRVQATPDGGRVRERFNAEGQRVMKELLSASGQRLERWIFDPEENRILRYEKNQGKEYRIAKWAYGKSGSFIKTNKIFSAKGKFLRSFSEYVSKKDIKYREDWYDREGRLTSRKLWSKRNGEFVSHLYISYLAKGFSKRSFLDEKGSLIEEMIYDSGGRPVKAGFVGLGSSRKNEHFEKAAAKARVLGV